MKELDQERRRGGGASSVRETFVLPLRVSYSDWTSLSVSNLNTKFEPSGPRLKP